MSEETWKKYDERYEVSSFGNVRNEKGLLKFSISEGYYSCSIHGKSKKVHKLVAIVFLDHIPCGHKIVVDHKDNNPLNNHKSNLQLITHRENSSKDRKRELPLGVYKKKCRFQSYIELNGVSIYLGSFNTSIEASEYYLNAVKSIENGTEIQIKKAEYSSKFKGVYWDKLNKKWRAIKNKKHIGSFKTELEAYNATLLVVDF
jgi:hypothetical protein